MQGGQVSECTQRHVYNEGEGQGYYDDYYDYFDNDDRRGRTTYQ